ncbi:peroxiredoxin [Zavarzinia aquatilis]|uniref:thioredoxin-dependent peroxiredoxin n=1 Tax=Zavarzinia aquatilis TaxID=2211142 RepID=A0A317EHL8_9PROT|nr:peroxiredoxin [Zavarzinia aquatilis]PWR25776.1 peroxiredoxin [Zavarzinia aquatilis]
MTDTLEAGSPAPDFTLPVKGGDTVSLAALKGRKVVLYFYPKDDTPGCTTEAIDFTARLADFEAAGASIVGVSRDSLAAHDRFATKHNLGIVLGADTDGAVTEAYGVWVEKMNYGRKYFGIERATFLIGADGRIARIWRKVKVKGHADEVLAAVQAL